MKICRQNITAIYLYDLKLLLLLVLIFAGIKPASAQCPPNIDFEDGTFTGWQCWVGSVAELVGPPAKNVITWSPDMPVDPALYPTRFRMFTSFPGNGLDPYGNFPRNCPNGSGHSIQLGNDNNGREAEGISYTFTIPAGRNEYSLIYHYAVVLQDPNHPKTQQPRMLITVKNMSDGGVELPCPMAPFVPPGLPGFDTSKVNTGTGIILYKPWAANSINLDGLAGKTIEIFFKTADCTQGLHFGYAYIDVNTECSSAFTGAIFCPDDAFINVTAPYGYQSYRWWAAGNPGVILGTSQTINFTPPPPSGTTLEVEVIPYSGYGCSDTLSAILYDTLTVLSNAGPDQLSCNNAPVQIGGNSRPGYVYSWSPVTGLSDPDISNPIATPAVTTQYIVSTTNAGGGCLSTDTVLVTVAVLDNTIQLIGPSSFCPDGTQAAILRVLPADSIQWYRNAVAIQGANQTQYNVLQSGTYNATVFSFSGCSMSTAAIDITVYDMPVAGFNTNAGDQCFKNNQFVFTNTTSVSSGSLLYDWDLGDGTIASTLNVTHSYTLPGTYIVRLIATTNNGCKDTSFFTVHVYEMPVAGFNINAGDQCFKNNQFVFTNTSSISSGTLQYNWDLGDGSTATTINVTHNYTLPGAYTVKLVVTSDKGCVDEKTIAVNVFPTPVAGFVVGTASQQCFKDNQFVFTNTSSVFSGNLLYNWDMGNGNIFTSTDITYSYPVPGTYKVKLLVTANNGGCKDSTSFNITVYPTPVAGFTVNKASQCLNNNQFIFANTSTVFSGALQYYWDLGDGIIANTANVTHSYAQPGIYKVRMLVTGDGGCVDSSSTITTVFQYPNADFYIQPATCTGLPVQIINKTINRNTTTTLDYLWEFGNGQIATVRNPVYSYPAPGNYTVKLTVNITGCPIPVTTRQFNIAVDAPAPGITYPEFDARFNFPETLHARQIGTSALWTPATSLDSRFSYNPVFKGMNNQLYSIQLKTDVGCITVDTQIVKTLKKISIYVPTVFTPDNNGVNDLLRPLLFGFDKVNYFRVYNRWGNLLFQMQSDRPGWDGKLNGAAVETQTIVWMIEAIDVDGKLHKQQGTTVLIR